jgi:hypothetical protein
LELHHTVLLKLFFFEMIPHRRGFFTPLGTGGGGGSALARGRVLGRMCIRRILRRIKWWLRKGDVGVDERRAVGIILGGIKTEVRHAEHMRVWGWRTINHV